MANNIVAHFRISPNDFNDNEHYRWLEDHLQANDSSNKSKFYKSAVIPMVEIMGQGKQDEYNKLIKYISLLGIDKVVDIIESGTGNKQLDDDQIQNIVDQVIQSMQSVGVSISSQQQEEVKSITKRKATTEERTKLHNLG